MIIKTIEGKYLTRQCKYQLFISQPVWGG